jgi:dipeptidyl aminopeptidase/acylaminoacyl peptidase
MKSHLLTTLSTGLALCAFAQAPNNLVIEGIPPIPEELRQDAARYLEFRSATFQDWHPQRREMLVTTRFADTPQLHRVSIPGGARTQLTFFKDRVAGGSFRPHSGEFVVFSQDQGGNEFHQLYRYDLDSGKVTLLTDGKSRNINALWSNRGEWLAYTSTRRNGRDTDIYLINPAQPESDRLLVQMEGGGWFIQDWSPDDSALLLQEYVSINQSHLHLVDVKNGERKLITEHGETKIAYRHAQFAKRGRIIFASTDHDSEFLRLNRIDLATGRHTPLTGHINWDIESFELSPDGNMIAFIVNENGVGVLRLLNTRTGKELRPPAIPVGIASNLKWHENGRDLAFNLSSAQSPSDVYSVDVRSGKVERWTQSEIGGLDPAQFVSPELVTIPSFDGLPVSGFLYRPDPAKFPGKRPVLIMIHGGPESQSRPGFQARNNYYLNELGLALLYPNVRGSRGYGKHFLQLDNGFKREDSVKDIGAFIDWVKSEPGLDSDRIGVYGGSYGGYMVLASMIHFGDQLRAGIDVVGISNFVTFLKNTQDYRRDLRRAEYGDERDPAMREFLEKISPTARAPEIKKPLFVVQGQNDPRVPVTESEQMVRAIRESGGQVWYLMARDEGHGFAKKSNADYQFLAMILFLREQLLAQEESH